MGLKRGNEVSIKEKVNIKDVRLRMKENETVDVILLGINDYVQYESHSSFNHQIYPQPCFDVIDKPCPFCEAYKSGHVEMKPVQRFSFAFYCVDSDKVMFWDATYTQGKKLIKQIRDFAEDIEYGTVFKFERTGKGTDTAYNLIPKAERKLSPKEKGLLESTKGMTVEDEMFEEVCRPVTEDYARELLFNGFGFGEKVEREGTKPKKAVLPF